MRNEKITCDGCGKDLTVRTNRVDYRLVLCSEAKPGYGAGVYTSMAIRPPVDRPYHFCDLLCLDHWRDREGHYNQLWRQWMDEWKKDHGTRVGENWSYPAPPGETAEQKDEAFRLAALVAFPMQRPKRS